MRISKDEMVDGVVKNGYDYDSQVWVKDYIIQDCGHPEEMKKTGCCNQHKFAGQDIHQFCLSITK